jgi:hypothetical protein
MQVFAADDDRPVHFGRHDGAGQDTATDRDHAGERALLVCKKVQSAAVPRFDVTSSSPTKIPHQQRKLDFVACIRGS